MSILSNKDITKKVMIKRMNTIFHTDITDVLGDKYEDVILLQRNGVYNFYEYQTDTENAG